MECCWDWLLAVETITFHHERVRLMKPIWAGTLLGLVPDGGDVHIPPERGPVRQKKEGWRKGEEKKEEVKRSKKMEPS
jgi:hypothetical protein